MAESIGICSGRGSQTVNNIEKNVSPLARVLSDKADLNERLHSAINTLEVRLETVLIMEPEDAKACPQDCIDAGSPTVLNIQDQNRITQRAIDKLYSLTRRLEV